MEHHAQLELLHTALQQCDTETMAFLRPILPMKAVQDVLLAFAIDRSRSFEDWVWDPMYHQRLALLRDQNPLVNNQSEELDYLFGRARQEHWEQEQAQHVPVSTTLLEDMEAAQADGKMKFKSGNHYAAANAFRKSMEALEKYHEINYYEAIAEWEQAMREKYMTLCCNLAICGIKLHDLAMIRAFATKALAVDATCCKAMYAMAKLYLIEHLYEEARSQIAIALHHHPNNQLLLKFQQEIQDSQENEAKTRQEMAEAASRLAAETAAIVSEQTTLATERQQQQAKRAEATRLPTLEVDAFAIVRLNTYFSQIKHQLVVTITPMFDPDNGEPPLFECDLSDGTTGIVLAQGIRASSKKIAKNNAAKVAIQKLWTLRREADALLPEDSAHWEQYQESLRTGQPLVSKEAMNYAAATQAQPQLTCEPVHLSYWERSMEPVMLLNQLQSQRRLQVDYEFIDLSPETKETTEFECHVTLNGTKMASARAIAKKKARTQAAQLALAKAYENKILIAPTTKEEDEEEGMGKGTKVV